LYSLSTQIDDRFRRRCSAVYPNPVDSPHRPAGPRIIPKSRGPVHNTAASLASCRTAMPVAPMRWCVAASGARAWRLKPRRNVFS
jgi:hypothetical protein